VMFRVPIRGFAVCVIPAVITLASPGCSRHATIPTATVTRGEFVSWLQLRAEVKAARALTLRAPMESGELRIVSLLPTGSVVAAGDTVAEFDASTIARTVDEKRTEVNGLAADIEKAQAEAATREAESVTAETTARFEVERTRLDYSGRDVLSRVEAEQLRLKVLDAEQKLLEAAAKLASVRAESRATLAATLQKRDKARRDLERAQTQLTSLRLMAPAPGSLTVMLNMRTQQPWQPFKPGDQVWPGAEIGTLPDASSLYVVARLDEVERGRLTVGQSATVRAEALPDRELKARVQTISRLAKADFTGGFPPPRNFDLTATLDEADARLRPGLTVTLRISVDRLRDAVTVPADAVFERGGEEVVYVMVSGRPRERRITVDRRSDARVVVRRGVTPGEQVALVDPTVEENAR
jgi:HlyD family secretion protein